MLCSWWPRRGRRSLSNGTRLMDWPCSIPMRPIGFSAPMSMDSAAQRMLARSLSTVHLIYGVKWALYRATVSVTQFMIPDEILWRIAVYWPDLGNHWHEASWRLHPVDDSRSASCLPDLIQPTYVLVMPGLLNEMAHRPHGLLEVTQGDICHVRATVLPPRIICLSCKSSSRHFVGGVGLRCGVLAPTIESP